MEELQVEVGSDEVGEHRVVVVLIYLEYLLVVGLDDAKSMIGEMFPQRLREHVELEAIDEVIKIDDAFLGLEVETEQFLFPVLQFLHESLFCGSVFHRSHLVGVANPLPCQRIIP